MTANPQELARDAELSRARLDLAIDRLENRLTPIGFVDEALGVARRSAAMPIVDQAMRSLRRNPLPMALIAAGAGLLAWRLWEQSRSTDRPALPPPVRRVPKSNGRAPGVPDMPTNQATEGEPI